MGFPEGPRCNIVSQGKKLSVSGPLLIPLKSPQAASVWCCYMYGPSLKPILSPVVQRESRASGGQADVDRTE